MGISMRSLPNVYVCELVSGWVGRVGSCKNSVGLSKMFQVARE